MATNTARILSKINAFVRPPEYFLRPRPAPKKAGSATTAAAASERFRIVHEPDRALVNTPWWAEPRTDAEYKAAIKRMKLQEDELRAGEERPRHTTRATDYGSYSRATPTSARYPPGPVDKERTASGEVLLRAPRLLSERALIHLAPRARRGEQKPRRSRRRRMDGPGALGVISPAATPPASGSVCESTRDVASAVDRGRRARYRRDSGSMAEASPARRGRISQDTGDSLDTGRMSECYVCQEPCQPGTGLCRGCKDLFQPLSELFESSGSEYEDEAIDTPYHPPRQSLALPATPPRSVRREDSISSHGEAKGDGLSNWSEWSEWSEWAGLPEPPASSQRTLLPAGSSPESGRRVDSSSSRGEAKGDSPKGWAEWAEWSEWSELAKLSSSSERTLLRAGTASRSSSVSPTPHLARQLKVVPHHDIRKVSVTLPLRGNHNTAAAAAASDEKPAEDRQSALHHIQQDMRLREPLTPGVDPGRQGRDAIRVGSVHSGEVRLVDNDKGRPGEWARDAQPQKQSACADWFRYHEKEIEDGCGYASDRDAPVSPMTNCELFKNCRGSCRGSCRDGASARSSTYDRICSIYNTYCDETEDGEDDGMF